MKNLNIKLKIQKTEPRDFKIGYSFFEKSLGSVPGNKLQVLETFPLDTNLNNWEIIVVYSHDEYILGEVRAPIKNFTPLKDGQDPFIPIRFIFSKIKVGRESKPKRWITPFYYQIHADKLDTINRNISKLYDPIMSMI
jgi:hypothetical protein